MADRQYLSDRLLQAAISKAVAERLGSFAREFGELTKGMTDADAKEAKLMFLEMVRNAFGEFYAEAKTRIESQKGQPE